jgi:hypothetical protein
MLGALCLPLPGHAFVYWAKPIEGWVVDGATGKPVEGVAITAHWQLEGGPEGGSAVGQVEILETVTDTEGHYFLPAWGPRFAARGTLGVRSPRIFLFKPGYRYRGLANGPRQGPGASRSDWDGKSIKLEPFVGSAVAYAQDLNDLSNALWRVGHDTGEPCGWQSFPRMLRAIAKQDADFQAAGVENRSVVAQLRSNQALLTSLGCGSVEEALKQ